MKTRMRITVLLAATVLALGRVRRRPRARRPADPKPTNGSTKAPGRRVATPRSRPSPRGDPDTTTVPVYFVGETPQGPRLFREFRKVEADNPAEEALALMTAGDALDPDYSTLYPGGTLRRRRVRRRRDRGEPARRVLDRRCRTACRENDARLAAQQLVYTVQGIAQERLPVDIAARRPARRPVRPRRPARQRAGAGRPGAGQRHHARGGRHGERHVHGERRRPARSRRPPRGRSARATRW